LRGRKNIRETDGSERPEQPFKINEDPEKIPEDDYDQPGEQ